MIKKSLFNIFVIAALLTAQGQLFASAAWNDSTQVAEAIDWKSIPSEEGFLSERADSTSVLFAAFGDFGSNNSNEQAVADLVHSWNPDFIVTTGDNSYDSTPIDDNIGKYYSDFIGDYVGSYGPGSPTNRFFPSVGNHDYTDGGGITAHYNYFTLPGNERYYDFVQGPVHFFVIDSNPAGIGSPPAPGDGRSDSSTQAVWLQAGLGASTSPWKIVYMHHPPYSSATTHGSEVEMQWPYEEWGATAVFAGHDHVYERIIRDDNSDGIDFGYFTTGAGGRSLYGFGTPVAGSQVRYNSDYGSMLITASDTEITYEFWSVAGGGTLIDTYTMTATPNWTAYNDLAAFSNTTPDGNFTFITTDSGGVTGLPSSGELVKFADGTGTGVTLTVTGGSFNGSSHVDTYTGPALGEAATIFTGIAGLDVGANFDATGTISYQDAAPPAGDLVLTFDGMDPNKVYSLVFFGHRDNYAWDRAALATISDVDAFTNESSVATDNPTGTGGTLFDGPSDPSTRLPSDNDNGYVARFTGINAGTDGTMLLTISYDGTVPYRGKYANAIMLEEYDASPPDLICETFDAFTVGNTVGTHADWFDGGSGPVVNATGGVAASQGLGSASAIFTWTAHPFDWNAADFQSVQLQADFQTDASGHFDDDRIGWMTTDSSTSSNNIFGLQLDPGGGGYNIEAYWDGDTVGDDGGRYSIVTLPTLSNNAWYRFFAEITKLTATSAQIDVSLTELDASGNPVAVVASGSIPDTDLLPNTAGNEIPNPAYFTGPIWPAFKNYTTAAANADNTCYKVVTGAPSVQYDLTVNVVGNGSVTLDPPGGTYDEGTVVQLTADPDPGWAFDGWSGDLSGSTNPENITMDANKSVTATFELLPTPENWTSYVDLRAEAVDNNHANVLKIIPTGPDEQPIDPATNWVLKDFSSGVALPITMTVDMDVRYPTTNGTDSDTGTDADLLFGGIVDGVGGYEIEEITSDYVTLNFGNLDPTKEYTLAVTYNRANPDYDNRVTQFTVSGADTYDNASSSGVYVHGEDSVSFSTGNNTALGYVAQWTGITAADGSFSVNAVQDTSQPGWDGSKAYAMTSIMLQEVDVPAELICETFDAFTVGNTVGTHADWYDGGGGPVVNASGGVASSQGLDPANNIFTWVAHPFDWNAADFNSVHLQADFQTDASGYFDDDRMGWMISDSSTSSTDIFGVQLDHSDGGIVTYWREGTTRIQDPIVPLSALSANTWYRFSAEITKLTVTSASIDVSLVELDAAGDPTGTPYTGTVADTSAWPGGVPNDTYFTAPSMWPGYKNYSDLLGAADNTCYKVVTGGPPVPTTITFQDGTDGYAGTVDTYIMEDQPTSSFGSLESVEWDNDDPPSSGLEKFALIRFDDIFGPGPNQIPVGATVLSANVKYVVYNVGNPRKLLESCKR